MTEEIKGLMPLIQKSTIQHDSESVPLFWTTQPIP